MAAVAQPGALLCQGGSCDLQITKIMCLFRNRHIGHQRERIPHPRQKAGVHRIGLDPRPAGLREAAGLQRIDLYQRKPA